MEVLIRVPTALRELVAGAHTVVVDVGGAAGPVGAAGDAVTVGSVLDALALAHPALERRVRDELGRTRVHVNLFVGADNVRDLDGLATPIGPGDGLSIIPAISGG
jgi:molybdopterin synthase sulfur carrier subunit